MNKRLLCASAFAFGAFATTATLAGEAEDALIEKIVTAYGGDKLTSLKSIRVYDENKNSFPGQGHTADYNELAPLLQDTVIDYANKRASTEIWTKSSGGGVTHTRAVANGDAVTSVDYVNMRYQRAPADSFAAAIGASVRITDTLLALELSARAETAAYQGDEIYLGRPHDLISFDYPGSPPITLYIDRATGHITKAVRKFGALGLVYQFNDVREKNGIVYARGFEFYGGDHPYSVSGVREVSFNSARRSDFAIDGDYAPAASPVDASEMSVTKAGDGVYYVGQGSAFSMFVQSPDGLIGVGGYPGLTDRLAAYRAETGDDSALKWQIVSHHHADHLGGIGEALAAGARLAAPTMAEKNLKDVLRADYDADKIVYFDEAHTIGPVEIREIFTSHVDSYAVVVVPAAGAVFQADHYVANLADAVAPANYASVTFMNAFKSLGYTPTTMLSAHGAKAVPWSEFEAAVAAYVADPCPSGRDICAQ